MKWRKCEGIRIWIAVNINISLCAICRMRMAGNGWLWLSYDCMLILCVALVLMRVCSTLGWVLNIYQKQQFSAGNEESIFLLLEFSIFRQLLPSFSQPLSINHEEVYDFIIHSFWWCLLWRQLLQCCLFCYLICVYELNNSH